MSVREYLLILNGGNFNEDMTTGFIDIQPEIGDIPYRGYSALELSVDNENIITKRVYYTAYGDIPVSRTTSLNDDISLHCGKFAGPAELIQSTISALLEEAQQMRLNNVNYSEALDALKNALKEINSREITNSSKHQ